MHLHSLAVHDTACIYVPAPNHTHTQAGGAQMPVRLLRSANQQVQERAAALLAVFVQSPTSREQFVRKVGACGVCGGKSTAGKPTCIALYMN